MPLQSALGEEDTHRRNPFADAVSDNVMRHQIPKWNIAVWSATILITDSVESVLKNQTRNYFVWIVSEHPANHTKCSTRLHYVGSNRAKPFSNPYIPKNIIASNTIRLTFLVSTRQIPYLWGKTNFKGINKVKQTLWKLPS